MKLEITFDIQPKHYRDGDHKPTQREIKEYIYYFMNRANPYDESAYFRNVKITAKREGSKK